MPESKLKAEERRLDILRNAARTFAIYGLNGVSMKEIAHACRVNEALLYQHFSSKEELFREVINGIGEEIDGSLREIADSQPDGYSALLEVVKSLVYGRTEDIHVYAFIIHGMTASARHDDLRGLVGMGFAKLNKLFTELMNRGIEDGSLKPDLDISRCSWCIRSRGLAFRIMNSLITEGKSSAENAP